MPRITPVSKETAQGIIKEGYDMFMEKIGIIPKPMELMSLSPVIFETQLKRSQYLSRHPHLSFSLLAHIRYLVAQSLSYSFCMDFNKFVLKKLGLENEDFQKMEIDPSNTMLEENEKAMLLFVLKSVKSPKSITDQDIEDLRNFGWNDTDMVDALSQGVSMIDHAIMMEVFQMDQRCLVG